MEFPPAKYYWGLSVIFLLAVIWWWHALGIWSFRSPNFIANAAARGELRYNMTADEVTAALGDRWNVQKWNGLQKEIWCSWQQCIYLIRDQAAPYELRVVGWGSPEVGWGEADAVK